MRTPRPGDTALMSAPIAVERQAQGEAPLATPAVGQLAAGDHERRHDEQEQRDRDLHALHRRVEVVADVGDHHVHVRAREAADELRRARAERGPSATRATGGCRRRFGRQLRRRGCRRPASTDRWGGPASIEAHRRGDEREVRERLREVADLVARGVDLLGVQAQVVGVGQHLRERQSGVVEPARPRRARRRRGTCRARTCPPIPGGRRATPRGRSGTRGCPTPTSSPSPPSSTATSGRSA